jgi:dihydrofolate reductase
MASRKLKLFIAMSLDGYLAGEDDNLDFLSSVEKKGEDYGYAAFTSTIDTYIIGRKTYEVIKGMMKGEQLPQVQQYDCYVITRGKEEERDGISFRNDLPKLVNSLKSKEGKDIYCDGGGEVIRILLEHQLIDEMIISIIPVLLGKGKRLFLEQPTFQKLEHLGTINFDTGLVQLHYKRLVTE